jgi:hypothetical protein
MTELTAMHFPSQTEHDRGWGASFRKQELAFSLLTPLLKAKLEKEAESLVFGTPPNPPAA